MSEKRVRPSVDSVLRELRNLADPEAVKGMARFGINAKSTLGISIPKLRNIAKRIGKDHSAAEALWSSEIHEARILACFVDDPRQVTEEQMESWVREFDSWDVCDQVCACLFDRTPFAYEKAVEWAVRKEEFVKRAGFVLMAALAVHDKKAQDEKFVRFLPFIQQESIDNRNFVKKAVNWALRQIGKRSLLLNQMSVQTAKDIQRVDSKAARWISSDALRELTDEKLQKRLRSLQTPRR